MAAKVSYVVVQALVITKNTDGSDKYLYQGAPVPEFVSADEIKRLSDEGFIAKATDEAAADQPIAESN